MKLQLNYKLIFLFLLTASLAFCQGDPATSLVNQGKTIILGIAVSIAEIFLAFGFIKAGLTPLRGMVFIAQAILVAICVTHIESIVTWAKGLSLN